MAEFDAWIGRETRASDHLDEALAARWLATFDLPMPQPATDSSSMPRPLPSPMPQGIHFALCTPDAPSASLGKDGHPARGDSADSFLPPFPMPRRMWASSAMEFHTPIAIGDAIERSSRVASIKQKIGSTGTLAFVNVEHETTANGALSVHETQTLVYRDAAAPDAPLSPPLAPPGDAVFDAGEWDAVRSLTPNSALLFRYSALTFNTHRIHYDAPYARDVERYRGLVVHGPLTASLLLQLAARELGENRVRVFEFRGMSPGIAGEELHLAMRQSDGGYELEAFAADGRQITKAGVSI